MRSYILIAFFALIVAMVAAKAGPSAVAQHSGQHQQGGSFGLPPNGTLSSANSTSANITTTNSTTTEASAIATSAIATSTTAASATSS